MKIVLFACVHNAGRSQMAAAFFQKFANPQLAQGISAGTEPAEQVHPVVVEVMREINIDLSSIRPQKLTEELAKKVDLLITMGCGECCPYIPDLRRIDWAVEDPKGKLLEEVRIIRDEIKKRVQTLTEKEGWHYKALVSIL